MYLLDTNILLKYPSVFNDYRNKIVISILVIEELDGLKKSNNFEVAYQARRASHLIFQEKDNITFSFENDHLSSVDNNLLMIAKAHKYTLVTEDLNLIIKAEMENTPYEIYNKISSDYTGVKYYNIDLDENNYSVELKKILEEGISPIPMKENEFLIIRDSRENVLCRLIYQNGVLKNFKLETILNDFVSKIVPRNTEQECLVHLLKNKDISIISAIGEYGTGKSYLLINYALQQLQKGEINKIIYVPNNAIVENTRELGILPGDTIDKELLYMGPILDLIGEDRARDMITKNEIEIAPISVMRGRSFTNSILIVNEAQNLTTDHIKLLVARCGDGTRIFFDGDIKQSDSSIFRNKNGLKLLPFLADSNEFAKIFGMVKLKTIERSKTAQASAYLEQLLI